MPNRILDFSLAPARLRTRHKQLVVQPENAPVQTVPFEDIAVLLVSHPQITFSQSVLEEIAENGSTLIVCNKKSLPVGIYNPIASHHQPARRLMLQITATEPLKKKAWKQIVQAKITAQAALLQTLFGKDYGLLAMARRVKSGDLANVEAQAARRYWTNLFAGFSFHRRPDGDDPINVRLNFGYGVIRGIISRAVCGSGFHPAIGLHHHNQYNAYCLADDLMEPFRPIVDRIVRSQVVETNLSETLSPETKTKLLEPLLGRFLFNGEQQTLFECAEHIVASLVHFFGKERQELAIPDSFDVIEEEKPF